MSRTISLCVFKGCVDVCIEGKRTCSNHTKAGSNKVDKGICDCGKPAVYSSGLCGTCYQRQRRDKKKVIDIDSLLLKDQKVRRAITYRVNLIANPLTMEEAHNSYIRSMGWDNLNLLYPDLCKHAADFGIQ